MILALKVKDSFSSIFTNANEYESKKWLRGGKMVLNQPKAQKASFISKAIFLFKVNVQYVLLWLSA